MADKDPVMKLLSTFALNVPMTRLSLVSMDTPSRNFDFNTERDNDSDVWEYRSGSGRCDDDRGGKMSMAKPLSAFKNFFAVSVVYCSRRKVFLRALAPNFDVVDRRRAIAPWDQGARKKNIVHNLPT